MGRTTRSNGRLQGISAIIAIQCLKTSYQIPTILAYQNGTLVACGAEAREFIGDDQYEIARWFKV